jgi:hypothetical protein
VFRTGHVSWSENGVPALLNSDSEAPVRKNEELQGGPTVGAGVDEDDELVGYEHFPVFLSHVPDEWPL